MARKLTPEQRERLRQRRAEWDKGRREFEEHIARRLERQREEDERRERRRQRLRRLVPFLRDRAA
jgi:hypothetical protein